MIAAGAGLGQTCWMTPYDDTNIFARILRGEIPCFKIHESAQVLSFMDIMPRAPGHCLVIPKAPARNLLDVSPEALQHVMEAARRIAIAAKTALKADGITLQQFSESAGGQEVFHLHVHILPRFEGQRLLSHPAPRGDMAVLAEQARAISAALAA